MFNQVYDTPLEHKIKEINKSMKRENIKKDIEDGKCVTLGDALPLLRYFLRTGLSIGVGIIIIDLLKVFTG